LLRSLTAQLGLAAANADLYEDLKQFLTGTVKALVSAIDAKDTYTAGHSERVNTISMLLGSEMNLDLRELEALYWGSLLHDVGKIGMPEAILNKPTALDDTEVEIMQQHPQRGWEMLRAIERLRGAADGVRDHHERWDGQGYPRQLAGERIPIIARIIAVADTFDALISNRAYRKGRGAARALEVIEAEAGTQFDPAVVRALAPLIPLLDKHQWVLMSGQKPGRG
jgi:putative nucleotidyltransferase with HDIG domain